MTRNHWAPVTGAIAAISCLAACQSTVTTQTTFARPYATARLTKVFVVENLIGALEKQMGDSYGDFQATLTKGLQECGISSEFYRVDSTMLSLDTQAKLQAALAAAEKSGSDAILIVNEDSGRTVSSGQTSALTVAYSFNFTDAKTHQAIWTARSTLSARWNAGPKLAESMLANMKDAAILRNCNPSKGPT